MRNWIGVGLVFGLAWAQEPIFREEAKVEALFDAEVFMSGIYIQGAMSDLVGIARSSQGDFFSAGRARVSSYITLNDQFTLGIGALYHGILSGNQEKNPWLVSEAFVQADTFPLPVGMQAVLRVGRQRLDYGEGLLISDYYGVGQNAIKATVIPNVEWDWWIDLIFADISEGGALQKDTFYFPVEINTRDTQSIRYLYTKYELDMLALVLGKEKGESNYSVNIYAAMDVEDRAFDIGWRPMWFGGYIGIGPLAGFTLDGEVGWLTGNWDAQERVAQDFPDQLYALTGHGFKLSGTAFNVRAYYRANDMFSFGVSYHSFSGDNGTTPDIYEGWFPPCLRSTPAPNSEWLHWAGFGEVMTWNLRPGMWRSPFIFNPSDINVVGGSVIYHAFPVKYALVFKADFFAYFEYWAPPELDNYLGSEIDVSAKGTYADLADVGLTVGYFLPADRLQNQETGWVRPAPLNYYLTTGTDAYPPMTVESGSYSIRLWVYRRISL